MLEIHPRADCRLELAPIRLEDARTAIGEEVPVLRVDDNREVARAGAGDGLLDDMRHQDALVVVFEHDRVRDGNRRLYRAEELLYLLALEVRILLFVHAD